jgi:hypothetical protein
LLLRATLKRHVGFNVVTGQAENADEWRAKLEAATPAVGSCQCDIGERAQQVAGKPVALLEATER